MFVSKYIDVINSDGEHAKQTQSGWQFDAEAVKRIDELRGLSQVAIVEQEESERVKELREENENLRQLLLVAQSKLIKSQEDFQSNQKLLYESEKKLLAIESQSKESDVALIRTQADLEIEKAMRKVAEDKFIESQKQHEELKLEFARIKNRGLFDRILNNF